MNTYATKLRNAIDASLRETGGSLKRSSIEVATYTAQRAAHLATIVGQVGVEEAVIAERDAVCIYAGILTTREADAADQRIVGIIHAALAIGLASA